MDNKTKIRIWYTTSFSAVLLFLFVWAYSFVISPITNVLVFVGTSIAMGFALFIQLYFWKTPISNIFKIISLVLDSIILLSLITNIYFELTF